MLRSSLSRDIGAGVGLANLCLVRVWAEFLVLSLPKNSYYAKASPTDYYSAVLSMVLLAAVFAGAIRLLRRFDGPLVRWAGLVGIVLLLLAPVNAIRTEMTAWTAQRIIDAIRAPAVSATLGMLLLLGGWLLFRYRAHASRYALTLLACLSPIAILNVGQAGLAIATTDFAQFEDGHGVQRQQSRSSSLGQVVIIVFDELDYRLALEARAPDIALPELDAFRRRATSATQAFAPSTLTEISMPAFISGIPFSRTEPRGPRDLGVVAEGTDRVRSWGSLDTIFSSAQKLGATTELVGWYHPYCRVLHNQLNYCHWVPENMLRGQDRTLVEAVAFGLGSTLPIHQRLLHLDAYSQIMRRVRERLSRDQANLTLIHLPVPHGPWIYNRRGGRLTALNWSGADGYGDNLALADKALGEIRTTMEAAGTWDSSAVVITADHAWRALRRSDGVRDPRVPLLVHLPGQGRGREFDSPVQTLAIHDMVLGILCRDVTTPQQVMQELSQSAQVAAPR